MLLHRLGYQIEVSINTVVTRGKDIMPVYTYRNKKTGKTKDLTMKIDEMIKFEETHPNEERVYDTVNVVDPLGIGVSKPPADFTKHVLGRIKASNPHNSIGEGRFKIPREV